MCFSNKVIKIFHSSKHWIDRLMVCDVITIVYHRGLVHRAQPDRSYTNVLQMAQLRDDT